MLSWTYLRIMKKIVETTILYLGLFKHSEKDIGNCYTILGVFRHNEQDNGNYYTI